jgi:hypothetical protein
MAPSGEDKRTKRTSGGDPRPGKAAAAGNRRRPAHSAQPSAPPASSERGVLSSLPSTRPQRPSARRTAARSAAKEVGKLSDPAAPAPAARGRGGTRTRARRPPKRTTDSEPTVPRQGFETEDEIAPGSTVQPPSRPELAAAIADLLGELAQEGLTAGGRLLKDVLGRLPGV